MPIKCPISITSASFDEFSEIDYRVMGCAYASQNELGRLCDECVYQADVRERLTSLGLKAETEIPLTVTYHDFSKTYFLDLVVENTSLYELKTVSAFTGEHDAQAINYTLLLDLPRAKLLNFRPAKVEGRLIRTRLNLEQRRNVQVDTSRWIDLSDECATLRQVLLNILADWGTYLDISLYEEALTHFLGGEADVVRRLTIMRQGIPLGTQRFHLNSPGIAFRLTGLEQPHHLEAHLRQLLIHTELRAIQWINFNGNDIRLATLTR